MKTPDLEKKNPETQKNNKNPRSRNNNTGMAPLGKSS